MDVDYPEIKVSYYLGGRQGRRYLQMSYLIKGLFITID